MFKYYEDDSSRLGKPLPLPTIEEVKEIGNGQKMYKLRWVGDGVTEDWMTEDFFHQPKQNHIINATQRRTK